MMMLNKLLTLRSSIKQHAPLIHCLTNHITSNDCANALLAVGARPIMAEHPQETEEITRSAGALLVNIGNISDQSGHSMLLSGRQAKESGIPCVIDLVGVAASTFRLNFAQKFITECRPRVIKGNISEIIAFWRGESGKSGVDADERDKLLPPSVRVRTALSLSEQYGAAVLISGATDVIVCPPDILLVENGDPLLSTITGTGCVQGALAAAFSSGGDALAGTVLAAALLSICAQAAASGAKSPGSFKTALLDRLYDLPDSTFLELANIRRLNDEKT
jgi:hydroxyethylthiazole kinase